MKYAAILLTLVFLASAVCVGYLWLTCEVTVDAADVTALEASAQPALFAQLAAAYPEDVTGGAADYVFYTWRLRLRNTTFVPIEQVEARVHLKPGDVCQTEDGISRMLAARSEGDLEVTALCRRGSTPMRDITVSWYLWGRPYVETISAR